VEEEASAAMAAGPLKFEAAANQLRQRVERAGETFLKLEKYVNLNFTGFNKILKKHDKRLPNPCKSFYIHRLHEQSWVRGDYSDVLVTMSGVYAKLRGDEEIEAKEDDKQDFVRSTRKYWVHTEDVSAVKCIILQHLPVFLQKTSKLFAW
jgi:SPX domain protein involved in polyphosphate accumulation